MEIDELYFEKIIDKGEHSDVYLAYEKENNNIKYAAKRYDRALIEGPEIFKSLLHHEIKIFQNFNHQNILKLFNLKKTKENFYTILEYCNGGNLSTILDNYQLRYGQPFSQEIVQHLMRQLISGLKNIFEKKLVHGDIKLKSILIHFDTEKDKEELNMMKATIKFSRFKNSLKPQKILNQELMKVDDKLLDDIKKKVNRKIYLI